MHEPRNLEPRPILPRLDLGVREAGNVFVDLFGPRRILLVSLLASTALVGVLVLRGAGGSEPRHAATPAAVAVTAPAVNPVQIASDAADTLRAAPKAFGEAPPRAPAAAALPAEEEANLDLGLPLVTPVMPRVSNDGPTPLRKPGIADPSPTTSYVVIVDGDSGAVLFERNAHTQVAPASLTKIMTAILGIEHGNVKDDVQVDVDAGRMPESTVMGLEPWSEVTFEDLLYGLMLPSGNDAALAIGRHLAGSDAAFVKLMNAKAQWLGLQCTHFANPHGLDDPQHYSCPADMVTMARYAMQYPLFREIVAARSYDWNDGNTPHHLLNLNPLLNAYPGVDGVKTGLSDNAGRALVGTAVKDGHRVYVGFMRSENGAASDGAMLLEWAFSSFVWPTTDDVLDARH